MKGILAGIFVLVACGLILFVSGCSAPSSGVPAAAAAPADLAPAVQTAKSLTAEGKLVPQRAVTLSQPIGGTIAEVLVAEGDQVEAGQVMLRLDARHQAKALAQAESALRRSEAQRASLAAGPRPEEIAAAQAAVEVARVEARRLSQAARPEDIAAAKAALAGAQADRQKALEGADPEQLAAAQADMANAEAAVRQAQAAYDRVKGNPDAAARPEALALEQATNGLNAAKARYQRLQKGSSAATVAKANAGVEQANAQLNAVLAAARPGDVAAAEAAVSRAEAQLELAKMGPRPEALAVADVDVAAAKAEVDRAKAALQETELRAPFAGTVVTLEARAGELSTAGQPMARLAELTGWLVETTNLAEINIAQVHEGDAVTLTFDALPGVELPGEVTAIRWLGENRQGDIVHTVTVIPEGDAPGLRWNMTTVVTFMK